MATLEIKEVDRFSCVFELVRGGFDVLTSLAGALDNGCDEVDPVLREVVAVVPCGVAINAVGVLERDRVDRELACFWDPRAANRMSKASHDAAANETTVPNLQGSPKFIAGRAVSDTTKRQRLKGQIQ